MVIVCTHSYQICAMLTGTIALVLIVLHIEISVIVAIDSHMVIPVIV